MVTGLLLIFLGLEYLAFLFFIIYVGAISIIFLFVVMLLDLRSVSLHMDKRISEYFIILLIFSCVFVGALSSMLALNFGFFLENSFFFQFMEFFDYIDYGSNIMVFGEFLYNYYYIYVYFLALYLLLVVLVLLLIVFFKYSVVEH
jgi:NADH:ubiquinone oxidoreductase subunit 6 (subunit J)